MADLRVDAQAGDYRLFLLLRRSRATTFHDGKLVMDGPVQPGTMYLVPPGGRIVSNLHQALDGVALTIPGHCLRAALRKAHAPLPPRAVLRPNFQVVQLARTLPHVQTFGPIHGQLFVDGMVDALLAFLLRSQDDGSKERDRRGLTRLELQRATRFAAARMEEPLRLDTWAEALHMSPAEFARRFRAAVGCSPYAWFMDWRIERAKELMQRSDVPLGEVAFAAGFANQSHFTEAFRRRVGQSPARWRQARCSEQEGGHAPLWRRRTSLRR